jgi:hypothetical protein
MLNQIQTHGALKWCVQIFILAFTFCVAMILFTPLETLASPQYSFGQGQGRTDTINVNDFHTASWERFSFNYSFTSGMEYRFDLGNPTSFMGFVPVDVYSVNVRRDANTSLQPPQYGIFSGFIPTNQSNFLFPQSQNPTLGSARLSENLDIIPWFDTLLTGVNASPVKNQINMFSVGNGAFLPPTSIAGS